MLLSVKNVSVGYGNKIIVRNVSFDVSAGEYCGLLGLNGSGKTTLLKGICGLLPLSGGCVLSDDADLTGLNERTRAQFISYIPQRHSKLIGISVLDAVLMGRNAKLGLFESPSAKDKTDALSALDKMKISCLAAEDFSRLSEGQKQLVILSRALLQNTPVILMDEPDSSLDFLNKHMMLGCVRDMAHAEDKACIVTLHDPNLAVAYCDRLILIDKGAVVSELDLRGAERAEIEECLCVVYGDLRRPCVNEGTDV